MIYDLFYVSQNKIKDDDWLKFRQRFPSAQKIEEVVSFDDIKKRAFTKLFWVVWDDLEVVEDFKFDYRVPKWDEQYIHVFKNGKHFNGINIFSKDARIAQKEFDFRFFTNKKEIDTVASVYKEIDYDIVFISYNEVEADTNYQELLARFPRAKRVHGIKGIHNAHIEAAKVAETDMFWVVDGDAKIIDEFHFKYKDPEKFTVYVWQSQNPINNLIYGYGGVKLLPRRLTLKMDVTSTDMTTSISTKFQLVNEISNITAFNTSPSATWKSAFRECVKLASKVIDRNYNDETEYRLQGWCTKGEDKTFGKYSIGGARAGKAYGEQNIGNSAMLSKINDFVWLHEEYEKWLTENE